MATTSSALLNAKFENGQTPLIMACDALNVELVKALMNERVKLNEQDDYKNTALIATINSFRGNRSSEAKKLEIVKTLLKAGVDKSLVNRIRQSALICAAIRGYREIIKVLVDDDPAAAAQLIPRLLW